MATKKCPSCGKKIVAGASFCIYCNYRFPSADPKAEPRDIREEAIPVRKASLSDDAPVSEPEREPDDDESARFVRGQTRSSSAPPDAPRKRRRIIIAVALGISCAALLTAVVCAAFRRDTPQPPVEDTPTTASTGHPTEDPDYVSWLQGFLGEWVDEQSVGKGNIPEQGGGVLMVHSIQGDLMRFDLISYSGGDAGLTASLIGAEGTVHGETVKFSFTDDGLGNAGNGNILLSDSGIDMEIAITSDPSRDDASPHSLAMNVRFRRSEIPSSSGVDLRGLITLDAVRAVAGEETEDPMDHADGTVTHTFGPLRATVDAQDSVQSLRVNYVEGDVRGKYRFDRVDGTMTYQVIKTYFGEAEHDYTEQPTNIRVLHYALQGGEGVTFTFDVTTNSLIDLEWTVGTA